MASTAFNYVTEEKSSLYRTVMRAFTHAKTHFIVHLRPPDVARVHASLRDLSRVFADLADNAQAFMAGLGRSLDLRNIDHNAFLAFKEKIIDYLKRFIGDLAVLSPDIARLKNIEDIDAPS